MPAARAEAPPRLCLRAAALLLALALAALLFASSAAHAEKLPFKNFTTSDGLAQDQVTRIVRDSRGFLWFCTSEGLSRFDGYQFKNYTMDQGLPHRSVNDLLEARDGQYWLATGGGLVLFNPQGVARPWTGRETREEARDESLMFRVFRPEDGQSPWDWFVTQIIEDRKGNILCAADGLSVLDRSSSDWKLRRVNEAWRGKRFRALVEDNSGALWLASDAALHRLLPDGNVQTILDNLGFASLLKDKNGNIWAGGAGLSQRGLHQFTCDGLERPKLLHVYTEADGLPSLWWHYGLLETADGTIWVGGIHGLAASTERLGNGVAKFRTISKLIVASLGEDTGGNVWVGTESSGVFRLSRSGFKSFDEKDGLKTARGLSITIGVGGEVYLVPNVAQTIYRFDGDKFTAVSPLGMVKGSWGFNQYHFQDHTGEWWVAGDYGVGLQRYPKVSRLEELAQTKPKRLYTTKDGLPDNMIFRLFEDSRGDIWIGTLGDPEDGVSRWERATDKINAYSTKDGLLPRNGATAFGEDHAGNIWIGFYVVGLARYRDGHFQLFTEKDGLPVGFIRDIYTDSVGRVWVATSRGIVRIDEPDAEQPRLVNISTAEGLVSIQTNCVTEDNFGRIYIGTGRGVNRLDPNTGRVKLFTAADGLSENLVQVCERDSSGALWFGFHTGLSRFVPEPDIGAAPPPIFISDVIVNGTPFTKLSELGETELKGLDLSSEQRQIRMEFFALGFSSGEKLLYQYKLEGVNDDWSAPADQRSVNLNLAPGSYRFLVRAVNAEGVTSQSPAAVSFSIARPVWQRTWFLALAALVAAAAVSALYRYRVGRLVELERVRTRIATDLHDDIGASLSQIAILSEVVNQRVGGERSPAAEPLSQIAGTSREMVDSMSDIVWAINPQRDHLSDLTQRMRRFADDLLGARDISLTFRAPEADRHLRLGADLRREVYLIFKETVNNLAKHSRCAEAEVEFRVAGDWLTVRVRDDGEGFDAAAAGNGRPASMGGHGLQSMRRRAASLGGSYEVESARGRGTTVTLRVPLGSGRRLREILRGVRLPHK